MEKKVKLFSIFALLLCALSFYSCSSLFDSDYDYKFVNDSSYTLSIQPSGQDWDSFSLSPGSSKTITTEESFISFFYDYANYVSYSISNNTVTFTNK